MIIGISMIRSKSNSSDYDVYRTCERYKTPLVNQNWSSLAHLKKNSWINYAENVKDTMLVKAEGIFDRG